MHGVSKESPLPAPIIPDDYELGFFNYITGYCFHALSKSQSMNLLQVVPGEGKTVRTLMSGRFPAIPAAETPTRIVSLQTVAYVQSLGINSCSYMMPSKTLAAKALSFHNNFVHEASADPDFEGFYGNVGLMLTFFYEDFMGLEGASGERSENGKRRVSRGTEFARPGTARPDPPPPPADPASTDPAPAADETPTPPLYEGAQGEAGPAEGAAARPSKGAGRRRGGN